MNSSGLSFSFDKPRDRDLLQEHNGYCSVADLSGNAEYQENGVKSFL